MYHNVMDGAQAQQHRKLPTTSLSVKRRFICSWFGANVKNQWNQMLILCSYPDKPEGCESNSVNTLKQLIMQRDGAEEESSFSRYLDPQQSAAGFLS